MKKILFRSYSDVLDQEIVETLWSIPIDETRGQYQLDNIPFYTSAATGDLIYAQYDEQEKMLTYRSTITPSGNSTIQVILLNKVLHIEALRDFFKTLGCASEKLNSSYFVLEVLSEIDYQKIKVELDKLEEQGDIEYAESCLAENHLY